MRTRFLVCAALLVFVAIRIAAVAEERVDRPVFKPGDRWLFRAVDGYTGLELRQTELSILEAKEEGVQVSVVGPIADGRRPAPRSIYSNLWPPAGFPTSNGSYIPLDFPLFTGKQWSMQFKVPYPDLQLAPERRTAKVGGWETVRVPAGEFRALRIVHEGRRRVHMNDGEFNVSIRDTLWYCPAVKKDVKREILIMPSVRGALRTHTIEELLEYNVSTER